MSIRWGLTGTVSKEQFEFQSILAGIGPSCKSDIPKELQDKGVLSQMPVNIVQLLDTPSVQELLQEELKYPTTNKKRLEYMAKLIQK